MLGTLKISKHPHNARDIKDFKILNIMLKILKISK